MMSVAIVIRNATVPIGPTWGMRVAATAPPSWTDSAVASMRSTPRFTIRSVVFTVTRRLLTLARWATAPFLQEWLS